MALLQFKIKFKNGSTQTVTATNPGVYGNWLVFGDGSGEVLRVPEKDVESVSRDSVADREDPVPIQNSSHAA
jgi:hypothetical protein